jgi:hypothetical protein
MGCFFHVFLPLLDIAVILLDALILGFVSFVLDYGEWLFDVP